MKNRFLSILIVFALVFSIFGTAFAEDTVEISDAVADSIEILTMLGIIEGYDEGGFDASKEVTRGEFVCNVANLIKADISNMQNFFYDVTKIHYAYGAVSALSQRGILNGNGDKLFYPDDVITLQDASKILLSIMRYDTFAEANGGYPMGYMLTAQKIGLLKGCSNSATLTIADMFTMLENALTINMVKVTSVSNDGSEKFETTDDNFNILAVYHDCYYGKGVVTATNGIDLNGEVVRKGRVIIDDIIFEEQSVSVEDYFGQEVEYIFSCEDINDDNADYKLLWVRADGTSDVITIIPDDSDVSFDNNRFSISYFDEFDKRVTETISQNVSVIYNGEAFDGDVASLINSNLNISEIKLISTNSNAYDVMLIKAYENTKVASVSLEKEILYGYNGRTYNLNPDDYNSFKIIGVDGNETGIEAIVNDMIASVFYSKIEPSVVPNNTTGTSITIYLSATTVEGTITEFNDDEILIGEDVYKVADESVMDNVAVGATVIMRLDAFGEVVEVETTKVSAFAGYLLGIAKGNSIDDTLSFRLLCEDAKIKIYTLDTRVDIDGETFTNPELIYDKFTVNDIPKYQLMLLETDTEGRIDYIDTIANPLPNTLCEEEPFAMRTYNAGGDMRFGLKIPINNNSKVFCVPIDSEIPTADESEFYVKNAGQLSGGSYNVASYARDDKLKYTELAVIKGHEWAGLDETSSCILVDDITSVLDEEEGAVECLKGYQMSSPVELNAAPGFSFKSKGVKSGDIIRIAKNASNEVIYVQIIYSYGQTNDLRYDEGKGAALRLFIAYANDRNGSMVKLGKTSGSDYYEKYDLAKGTFTIYDSALKKDRVSIGSYSDIIPYTIAGDDCSLLFLQAGYGYLQHVIIYK